MSLSFIISVILKIDFKEFFKFTKSLAVALFKANLFIIQLMFDTLDNSLLTLSRRILSFKKASTKSSLSSILSLFFNGFKIAS
ncbi:MAG: hypothetical protein LBC61_05260 [Candidatus Peribacteria bacterium]|nr:hypothetical protein [Candidatus Peribacteria bacterium]